MLWPRLIFFYFKFKWFQSSIFLYNIRSVYTCKLLCEINLLNWKKGKIASQNFFLVKRRKENEEQTKDILYINTKTLILIKCERTSKWSDVNSNIKEPSSSISHLNILSVYQEESNQNMIFTIQYLTSFQRVTYFV